MLCSVTRLRVSALTNVLFMQLTFKPQLNNRLREKFPAPSFHDDGGRGRLTEEGFKLLTGLLTLCPEKRLTAAEALQSKW